MAGNVHPFPATALVDGFPVLAAGFPCGRGRPPRLVEGLSAGAELRFDASEYDAEIARIARLFVTP